MKNSLIIILFDHPQEHTADYSGQTAKLLRNDNMVIGVLLKDSKSIKEMIFSHHRGLFWKKISENYHEFTPFYIIPFRRFECIVRLNLLLNSVVVKLFIASLIFRRKIKKKYVWVFNPDSYTSYQLFGSSFISLYDCVDYHGNEPSQYLEKLLIRSCDLMVVNSHVLYDVHRLERPDIQLVPLGFDLHTFSAKTMKSFIHLPHNQPIIGYIGGINSRLDYHLLLHLIKKNNRYDFIFVGPIQEHETHQFFESSVRPKIDALFSLRNVHHFPYLPKDEIPGIISQFDICMIPYDVSVDFNRYCYPMKLFEYFYMGKPVISTPIEELKRFPKYVKIGHTGKDWGKHIQALLVKPWPKEYQKEQRKLALANTWRKKIKTILKLIKRIPRSSAAGLRRKDI